LTMTSGLDLPPFARKAPSRDRIAPVAIKL
jgi:hypothetical protein